MIRLSFVLAFLFSNHNAIKVVECENETRILQLIMLTVATKKTRLFIHKQIAQQQQKPNSNLHRVNVEESICYLFETGG